MSIAEKLTTIAENEQKVFDAGKQAEYDRFWDAFQQNGNKTDYRYAFSGYGWTAETFRPKYDIVPTYKQGADAMFQRSCMQIDLAQHLENLGVTLDFSHCTFLEASFNYADFTRIPTITLTGSGMATVFSNCSYLRTIDKIILLDDGSQLINNNTFSGCSALKNITFEGVIGKSINFNWSPLTPESMASIICHLVDHYTTEALETNTYTVKFNDACWEALEASDLSAAEMSGYSACETWKQLVEIKGWLY